MTNCKGFAYMKDSERYKIVYGESPEHILNTLAKWNKTRSAEQQYVYCNIGTLDPEMNKYIRYQKYDVATGRNISSLWLTLPGMSKEEFQHTIQECKEKGAKFHSVKRRWYISPDNPNMEFFEKYLQIDKKIELGASIDDWMFDKNGVLKREYDEIAQVIGKYEDRGYVLDGQRVTEWVSDTGEYEIIQNSITEKRFLEVYDYIVKQQEKDAAKDEISQGYSQELVSQFQKVAEIDSRQMEISKEKLNLLQELVEKDIQINGDVSDTTKQILEAYGAEIRAMDIGDGKPWVAYKQPEQVSMEPAETVIEREEYVLSISRETEDNRCTIYYRDGRLPVDLRGDQFNVHFPSCSEAHVQEIVQGYLENNMREYPETPVIYNVGDEIDVYTKKTIHVKEESEAVLIKGIEHVTGIIQGVDFVDDRIYSVKDKQGIYSYIPQSDIYSDQQVAVLQRAIKDQLPPEKFHIVANPELGSAQMEEFRFAFKDGFSVSQVQEIANVAKNSWQIALYRYGMQHGIELKEIQGICANESKRWNDCHQEVNEMIQQHRKERIQELHKQGFQADIGIIKKMETIDHLTGRKNSLKDICTAFKEGTYEQTPAGEVIKSLGREFQMQELQLKAAMEPEP